MSTDFLPARNQDLAAWTLNFNTKITAAPTSYGLTAPMATAYDAVDDAWQAALTVASTPATRTKVTVAAMLAAKADVVVLSRQYAAIVQGWPSITAPLLETLGLTVRSTTRSPIPPPATYPLVSVLSAMGQQIVLSINDQNTPNARKLPAGAIAAEVYFSFAASPPVSLDGMSYVGTYSRYPTRFNVAGDKVGETCYILARWKNRRGEVGPLSAVASAVVSN